MFRIETTNKTQSNKEEMTDMIASTDKFVNEVQNSALMKIENVRSQAFEQLKSQESHLINRFTGEYDEVKGYMTKNMIAVREMSEKSAQTLTKSIKQIKEVCSKYFENYECDLEEMRLRTASLENKYLDWSKVLIEPATLNDARVFSLETRIQSEEEVRIKEYDFIKDLMRKLIYSLEQLSL
jgi:hypothetical protein